MRTNCSRYALLPVLACFAVTIGCGSDTVYPPVVSSLQVSPGTDSVNAFGVMRQFTAVVKDQYGNPMTGKSVVWRSSQRLVATIDSATGVVTAVANGTTQITATVDFFTGVASLTVVQRAARLSFFTLVPRATVGYPLIPGIGVEVEDAGGTRVANAQDAVTLGFGTNPTGATIGGTAVVNAVSGLATFSGLTISNAGTGYTFVASGTGFVSATSAPFTVNPDPGPFAEVSSGFSHTCGVTTAHVAYCWGNNSNGVIGDGTRTTRLNPTLVSGTLSFSAVSAGANHTCGVAAGIVYCWGSNRFGELGDGTTTDRLTPGAVPAPGGMTFASVTSGWYHTCAITTEGAAYCWGYNLSGQLGDGTRSDRSSPTPVSGSVIFATVSAGSAHTCGRTAASATYCWGDNSYGQLGNGTTAPDSSPGLVASPVGVTFAAVWAGSNHTCGRTAAGDAYCWGFNTGGQLGDGTTTDRSSPVLVAGGLTFTNLAPGSLHTCGATTASPPTYCWGSNSGGQLGDGTTTAHPNPATVPGFGISTLSVGGSHTCGTTSVGAVYCWGFNTTGQLGDGTAVNRSIPTHIVP